MGSFDLRVDFPVTQSLLCAVCGIEFVLSGFESQSRVWRWWKGVTLIGAGEESTGKYARGAA